MPGAPGNRCPYGGGYDETGFAARYLRAIAPRPPDHGACHAAEAETPIRLDEGTTVIFPAPEPEKSLLFKLIESVVHVLSRVTQALTIETPMVTAYVEGTELVLGSRRPGPISGCSKGGPGFESPGPNRTATVADFPPFLPDLPFRFKVDPTGPVLRM